MKKKTTRAQFNLFINECNKWIAYFGLSEWELSYMLGGVDKGNIAECYTTYTGKTVALKLVKETEPGVDMFNDEEIKSSAFHEVCELLLAPFNMNAKFRFVNEVDIDEARHSAIQRLSNTIYRDRKKIGMG